MKRTSFMNASRAKRVLPRRRSRCGNRSRRRLSLGSGYSTRLCVVKDTTAGAPTPQPAAGTVDSQGPNQWYTNSLPQVAWGFGMSCWQFGEGTQYRPPY